MSVTTFSPSLVPLGGRKYHSFPRLKETITQWLLIMFLKENICINIEYTQLILTLTMLPHVTPEKSSLIFFYLTPNRL